MKRYLLFACLIFVFLNAGIAQPEVIRVREIAYQYFEQQEYKKARRFFAKYERTPKWPGCSYSILGDYEIAYHKIKCSQNLGDLDQAFEDIHKYATTWGGITVDNVIFPLLLELLEEQYEVETLEELKKNALARVKVKIFEEEHFYFFTYLGTVKK